ncbi:hypothetical protein OMAG_000693 [Candidatus Omnitrophus magneticus]|uniref:Uncharacterized protein n=1 Tax=Candidatus Omnitrophus magneticus TaxID=1609969 RepID=A0A0F0CTS6_9BACT|nr:hypothetical protein OMAG_000693 [Candidatus Omnitrophus magneticus]
MKFFEGHRKIFISFLCVLQELYYKLVFFAFVTSTNPSSAIRDTSWLFYWILGKRSAPHLLG